jgi:hypothetical protein
MLFGAVSGITSLRASLDVDFSQPRMTAEMVDALEAMLLGTGRTVSSKRGRRWPARRPRARLGAVKREAGAR